MLLDMPRLESSIDRRFPPARGPAAHATDRAGALGLREGSGDPLGRDRHERGGRNVDPRHDRARRRSRAVRPPVRLWTAFIEVIPYIGPWLSASPARDLRTRRRPGRLLWVAALFVFIYQVEGHVVGAERHGQRSPAPPPAGDLRAARRRRALRHPRRARVVADDGGGSRDLGVLRRAHRPRIVGGRGGGPDCRRRRAAETGLGLAEPAVPGTKPPAVSDVSSCLARPLSAASRRELSRHAPRRLRRTTRCARSCARPRSRSTTS